MSARCWTAKRRRIERSSSYTTEGGMDIEEVAEAHRRTSQIHKEYIDPGGRAQQGFPGPQNCASRLGLAQGR